MTKEKEDLLEKCHTDFLEICFGDFPMDRIHEKVSEKITGYGTNVNEKIQSFDDFINLLSMQRAESEGVDMNFEFDGISKTLMSEGNAAAFVDEMKLTMVIEGGHFQLNVRLSSIFEYSGNQWWAVHFHGSIAQGVEGAEDTWAVNEWKEKNEKLEQAIAKKTADLASTIEELKATQTQLVVQEKLAALGQLAAGIAHEIKNPMNFINNFSELNLEYVEEILEMVEDLEKNDTTTEIEEVLTDISDNLKKIHQHGTRADSIVKSMLLHSRGGSGELEPTDLNELIGEYVNLAFHGMRAGKNPINVKIDYEFDENVGTVPVFPEDFSRVVLNLCKNAFDAMRDKTRLSENGAYLPALTVKSKKEDRKVVVSIEDNGPGMTDEVRKKLFEPFFTTKKGTEGTGLGLSITHDIIKNHKGEISIESNPDAFTRFIIEIPLTK